jgi:MFS transporter, ACS family, DAL5 transporter family protein
VPSNVFLKRFKPHIWLPITMVLWGAILIWMGFVKSYGQLAVARALLGVFEAGLFPGVNYYLSVWYKRDEFGMRAAIFFSAAAVYPFNVTFKLIQACW